LAKFSLTPFLGPPRPPLGGSPSSSWVCPSRPSSLLKKPARGVRRAPFLCVAPRPRPGLPRAHQRRERSNPSLLPTEMRPKKCQRGLDWNSEDHRMWREDARGSNRNPLYSHWTTVGVPTGHMESLKHTTGTVAMLCLSQIVPKETKVRRRCTGRNMMRAGGGCKTGIRRVYGE